MHCAPLSWPRTSPLLAWQVPQLIFLGVRHVQAVAT